MGALVLCLSCTSGPPAVVTSERPSASEGSTPSAGRSAAPASPACVGATAQWRQVNDLRGYLVHDGLALSDCELLLVGERLGERAADHTAVVLGSDDGGRTLGTRAVLDAWRLWRLLALNTDLWVLGEDATGLPRLFRSVDRARSWSSMALPPEAGSDITSSEGRLVVIGRTAVGPVVLVGDGTTWEPARSLPSLTQVRALAAGGRIVAVGGVDQGRGSLDVSTDAGMTFRRVELPSAYDAVSGLAVSDGARVIIGGYSGRQVENATAIASRLDVATGALGALDLPPAVQLMRPVCTPAFCLAVTPTGRVDMGDMIVRLQGPAGRWERMSRETTSTPLGVERIIVGPATAYAVGSALMRAQP